MVARIPHLRVQIWVIEPSLGGKLKGFRGIEAVRSQVRPVDLLVVMTPINVLQTLPAKAPLSRGPFRYSEAQGLRLRV